MKNLLILLYLALFGQLATAQTTFQGAWQSQPYMTTTADLVNRNWTTLDLPGRWDVPSLDSFPTIPDQPTVLAVHDGDSYKLQTIEPGGEWVRLMGVDCPEIISNHIRTDQEFGRAIGDSVRLLLKGQTVTFKTYGKDQYDRTLVSITIRGRDLGEYLLEKGWAWYYKKNDLDRDTRIKYRKLRDYAKRKKLGLWSNPNAEEPSAFRKRNQR